MKKSKTAGQGKKKQEKVSTPSIQRFFKNGPKSLSIGKNDKSSTRCDETKAVYVDLLKKRLEAFENGSDAGVEEEQEDIQNEVEQVGAVAVVVEKELVKPVEVKETSQCGGCKDWETKYKNLKKDYMRMGTNFAELRIKHDDLLATKTYKNDNESNSNDVVPNVDGILTSSEIEVLQNMPLVKQTDSTFILKCLKFAYKDNISVLRHKTLKGKSEAMIVSDGGDVAYMPGKDPVSLLKIKIIRELFVQRINKCNLNPDAYTERIKDSYMNKLIASGITNIGKSCDKSLSS